MGVHLRNKFIDGAEGDARQVECLNDVFKAAQIAASDPRSVSPDVNRRPFIAAVNTHLPDAASPPIRARFVFLARGRCCR